MQTRVLIEKGELNPTFARDDRIFLGEGLFETLKVDGAKPCFSNLHWERMRHSADLLGMPFDLSLADWEGCLAEQIKLDNLYHGAIKVLLSGGVAPRGLAEQGQIGYLALRSFKYSLNSAPIRLISSSWLRDRANPIYQHKSVNYLEAVIARRQALMSAADDVLFFNTQYQATETTCANFYLIKNDRISTPPLRDGVLPGITRARIVLLCAQQQIELIEQSVTQARIAEADAVFLSNALQGIQAVASVDEVVFSVDHPLFKRLLSLL